MSKLSEQIARMKALSNYGKSTEKPKVYHDNSVVYNATGADGKMYGIVKEGTKYYIKVMDDAKKALLSENFEYIGGFTNRKTYEYTDYSNALKNFDFKMRSIRDALHPKDGMIIESLDPNRREYLAIEATDEVKKIIARQREIMANAQFISEGKSFNPCKGDNCGNGDAKSKGKPFGEKGDNCEYKEADTEPYDKDGNPKKVNESEQTLAWNDNKDYMDKSQGTEVGDGAPFDKCPKSQTDCEAENGTVVEEGVKEPAPNEVNDWDKGLPNEAGTGNVDTKDGQPFEKKVNESVFDDDDEPIDVEGDDSVIDDTEPQDLDTDMETLDNDTEEGDSDIMDMLQQIMSRLDSLESKVTDEEFSDDDLYDGDEENAEDEIEGEEGTDDFNDESEFDNVYETVNYQNKRNKKINEDKLDDFGKHPAYRKEPFKYPNPKHQEKEGYDDWNDDSVESTAPYGEEIGDGMPFDQDAQHAKEAIAEAVTKVLRNFINGKKK